MSNRIRNKIQRHFKKPLPKSSARSGDPIFCKVIGTQEQLASVGCDFINLVGETVEFIRDFPTGYAEIRVESKKDSEFFKRPYYLNYDIPKKWLEF